MIYESLLRLCTTASNVQYSIQAIDNHPITAPLKNTLDAPEF